MPTTNTAQYEIWLLHQADGVKVKQFSDYISLDYAKAVNAMGAFSVTLNGLALDALEHRYLDWRVAVWRTPPGKRKYLDFAGFVRSIEYAYDGNRYTTTLSGPDYMDLLNRRVIAYTAGSAQAKKTTDYADDIIKDLFDENLGASATDTDRDVTSYGVSVQGDLSAGTSLSKSCSYDNLLTTCQSIAQASRDTAATAVYFGMVPLGEGWDMELRTKTAQWGQDHRFPSGADGPVVFAVERGNMVNARLVLDAQTETNYIYGGGAGQRADRLFVNTSDSTRIAQSVLNRREGFFDGSNYETEARLTSACKTRLLEGEPVEEFSFQPLQVTGTLYGVDYGLGDRVTATFLARQYDVHIAAVHVTVNESGESIKAEARTWP